MKDRLSPADVLAENIRLKSENERLHGDHHEAVLKCVEEDYSKMLDESLDERDRLNARIVLLENVARAAADVAFFRTGRQPLRDKLLQLPPETLVKLGIQIGIEPAGKKHV